MEEYRQASHYSFDHLRAFDCNRPNKREMTDCKTYTFKHCWVHCSENYTETVFHDGTRVPAMAEHTDEYREKAAKYGYVDDIVSMSREHEILHTFLAEYLGYGSSPTLWALAHPHVKGVATLNEQMDEEVHVLAFQVYLNDGPVTNDLNILVDACLSLECLKKKALALLRS